MPKGSIIPRAQIQRDNSIYCDEYMEDNCRTCDKPSQSSHIRSEEDQIAMYDAIYDQKL